MTKKRLASVRQSPLAKRVARLRARALGGALGGGVLRNMATLALGAGMARLIGVAVIPILTRLYSPEDYGVLAAFTAMILMLTPLTTLCYGMALPLPRQDGVAMNLLVMSTIVTLAISALTALALAIAGPWILGLVSMEVMLPWWWLLPLGLLGAGLFETFSFWATRRKSYRVLARAQVTQTVMGAGAQILLGLLAVKPAGLLIGHVIQRSAGSASLVSMFRPDLRGLSRQVSASRIFAAARRYASFPRYRLPSQFLVAVAAQSPLLLTSSFFGPDDAGRLGLALMTLAVPVSLFGQSMARAFYAEIADLGPRRPAEIRALTYAVLKRMTLLAGAPALVLLLIGPSLFSVVFGAEWEEAGAMASRLSLYLVGQLLWASVSYLLHVFSEERILLGLNLQRLCLVGVSFGLGVLAGLDIVDTITIYALLSAAHYGISIYRTLGKIPTRSEEA